jgi:hypothetical protein
LVVELDRAALLGRGARAGIAVVAGASVAAAVAGSARADALPDADLAYARLLVAAELLAIDFYTQALAAKKLDSAESAILGRAVFNEKEHYMAMSGVLTGAGLTPAVGSDFDFAYPKDAFGSKESIAKLGASLETTFTGAYLGAIDGLQTQALRQPAARIAANEAQHLSVLSTLVGGRPLDLSFPVALSIEQVSDTLDQYTS